jgi:hypothetical protein
MALLSVVGGIFFSSIVVVTSNMQFLDCANIVFGWQYTDPLFTIE